jgi:small subunit ribosomal protein S5
MAEEQKPEEVKKVEETPVEGVPEEEKLEVEKDVIADIPKEEEAPAAERVVDEHADWKAKTSIGKKVKSGEIKDIDDILNQGAKILEPEITEILLPNTESELLFIGQSKGKFGGGAKRIFKQTQKKTPEGNKPSFACFAVIGNLDGYVGAGCGKSKDTVPSREKAIRKAKLNVFKIRRGCGSWECACQKPHTIPFKVEGKCGSSKIILFPAPRGKGLCVEPECAKILKLAGIKDVWSKTYGQTKTKRNLIKACLKALKQLTEVKLTLNSAKAVGLVEGRAASVQE